MDSVVRWLNANVLGKALELLCAIGGRLLFADDSALVAATGEGK